MITYQLAAVSQDFEAGKKLFEEYAASLNVDLSFQNFSKELETISEQYHEPAGALLLARDGEKFVGCSGVRKLDGQTAELKRMYVKDGYRGYQIGLNLLERSIGIARELGYKKIRLDTLEDMKKAQQLYHSFGFYEIPPYRFNPLPGAIYMEKEL
ncbi:GNAT family N-acetyltransferase [Mucilaginibacter sp.]|jgi:ribosomal protein S18 acetylase RimI-like enzyme|uniref:GNAT family N-acetyltransferase n=1 Tax=Mucilaginibacter sp. TaxID=1882438 RepID=UPI002CB674F9|nr:GNAT family N-acetyltransferase [Mucilaginibacter sp.]HTI60569.1 GNAT family N-acetyltransferase [Mucilaginibacter sp.]